MRKLAKFVGLFSVYVGLFWLMGEATYDLLTGVANATDQQLEQGMRDFVLYNLSKMIPGSLGIAWLLSSDD